MTRLTPAFFKACIQRGQGRDCLGSPLLTLATYATAPLVRLQDFSALSSACTASCATSSIFPGIFLLKLIPNAWTLPPLTIRQACWWRSVEHLASFTARL